MSTRTGLLGAAVFTVAALAALGLVRQFSPGRPADSPARPAGAAAAIAAAVRPGRPVIFLGLDGADWNLLDQYMARGLMPNLTRLVAAGTSGRLRTMQPALSPLVWTTMMTGVGPLDHGVLDFVQFDPATGLKTPIGSTERRVPAIWNMATTAGKTAGVFGMWATYPAEPVGGLMVSDRLFTFLFKELTPPERIVFPAADESWARATLARAEGQSDYRTVKAYLPWLQESEYRQVAESDDPYGNPVSALRLDDADHALVDHAGGTAGLTDQDVAIGGGHGAPPGSREARDRSAGREAVNACAARGLGPRLAPLPRRTRCPGGGIGRRARLRILWGNPCWFDSSPGHHSRAEATRRAAPGPGP